MKQKFDFDTLAEREGVGCMKLWKRLRRFEKRDLSALPERRRILKRRQRS